MKDTKQQNEKITKLIKATVKDYSKIFNGGYLVNEEAIFADYNDEQLFYVFPDFEENKFDIIINCFIFSDLTISQAVKLKEIYKSEEVEEYCREANVSLWFHEDENLMMHHEIEWDYSNYDLFGSKLLLDVYIDVQNAKRLKDKLEALLAKHEHISVN